MKQYNKRTWLNPITKDATSTVVAFNGTVTDFKGKTYPSTFLEISDCQNKIRVHQTTDDSREDFIEKMKLLKSEIELFIIHLNQNSLEQTEAGGQFLKTSQTKENQQSDDQLLLKHAVMVSICPNCKSDKYNLGYYKKLMICEDCGYSERAK